MTPKDLATAIKIGITVAEQRIDTAKYLLEDERYDDAVNRAYYAVFIAISTALWSDGKKMRSHKQTLGEFNKLYIATGIFPKEFGKMMYDLQSARFTADYGEPYSFSCGETETAINNAEAIVSACKEFLKTKGYAFE